MISRSKLKNKTKYKKGFFMKKITIMEASKLMHKSAQFIRIGLQTGRLPFGSAVKVSTRWNYIIYPELFYKYLGISEVRTDE